MPAEAPRLPQFEKDIAQNITNDLADRAQDIEYYIRESRGMPSWIEGLRNEQNGLFLAMLEVRASERAAGRNIDSYLHNPREISYDPYNIHLDIHLEDNRYGDTDHRFSERRVQIDAGPVRFNTTLAALAKSRGLTSLDVLEIIGKPTSRDRNHEESHDYMSRLMNELLAAQQHKSEHPEDALEVDRISWDNAVRLIEMRKVRPEIPLRIGMYSRPTEDPDEPERNLVFVYGNDLFTDSAQTYGGKFILPNLLPEDMQHAKINPQIIIDGSGDLNLKRVAIVLSQPYLEEKIKTDGDPERWNWEYSPTEFDFFVLTNEDSGALSIYQNLPQNQA